MRRRLIVVGLALAAAAPILWVETSCRADQGLAAPPSAFGIPDAGYRRAEGDSYMTFPEWYIVYAYDDLAAVTRQSSESAFDYLGSVGGFWRSLCGATRAAGRVGPASPDQRVTDDIIGVSFSAEMLVIGAWERSLGALTAWTRGPERTPEDEFALSVADDYAHFLRQTPWYRYPFWPTLRRFWRETPFGLSLRGVERRVALSLEYGGKAIYAQGIGWLAGYAPADLTIRSVIEGLTAEDFAREPRLKLVSDLDGGAQLVETPRYQEFTDLLVDLARRGRKVREIAGAGHILVTVLTPPGVEIAPSARLLFSLPMQGRPGWRRVGLDVKVADLTQEILDAEGHHVVFEHAYETISGALKGLAATLFVWFAGMGALALVVEPPVAAVFGRAAPLWADPQLRIVAVRPGVMTVAGERPGWVRRLYAEGAWFVWPITASGCVGLRRWLPLPPPYRRARL